MSPRLVAALAVVTVITTVAAVIAALERPSATPVEIRDEPAFPALRENPDAVAAVTIETPERSFRLVRAEPGRWVAPDRSGYPVAPDQIRELIVQLADMRLIEPKTTMPERFSRLEVEDLDAEDAKSRLVRLEDADATALAEAIFGKRRNRLTGLQQSGIYLRRPGEQQSWLASGGIKIADEVKAWLDPAIMDVAGDTIRRIEVDPADAEPYAVVRAGEDEALTLEDLAADEAIGDQAELDRLAGTLAGLELVDVRPVGEIDWPEQPNRAVFTTFDGLEITVETMLMGDEDAQAWARFAVAADAGTADAETEAQTGAETAEAAGPRAEDIAARTDGWAYQIPKYIHDRLAKPRADLLKASEETS